MRKMGQAGCADSRGRKGRIQRVHGVVGEAPVADAGDVAGDVGEVRNGRVDVVGERVGAIRDAAALGAHVFDFVDARAGIRFFPGSPYRYVRWISGWSFANAN